MIPLWQGSANSWDCDEMGHMNVRIYVEKAMEGLGSFAASIGMAHAFQPDMPSTLMPAEHHIRFMREVLPGRPLLMVGCVLEASDTDVLLYQEMRHGDGTPAAAFRTRLLHVEARTGKPFAWSSRTRAALDTIRGEAPAATAPRSLNMDTPPRANADVTLNTAIDLGSTVIGQGMFSPQQCDVHGRLRAPWFMGITSDSVPNLLHDWRQQVASSVDGSRMGAAVLEYRLVYRRWPRAGDLFEMRSALAKAEEKTHSLVHWTLDPVTGQAWATSEAVAVTFDLNTRKVIATPREHMALLETIAPRGLTI